MMQRLLPIVLLAFGLSTAVIGQNTASRAPRNAAEFDELFQRISNWGRGFEKSLGAPVFDFLARHPEEAYDFSGVTTL